MKQLFISPFVSGKSKDSFFSISLSLVLERKLVPSKLANRDLNESHGESITSTPFDEGGRFREG